MRAGSCGDGAGHEALLEASTHQCSGATFHWPSALSPQRAGDVPSTLPAGLSAAPLCLPRGTDKRPQNSEKYIKCK
ncbi:hypothetical protein GDO81_010198 [Engystomops pustulosus]|uniref:Uncharacterized protein n=1 Tax=Engystomops pustulosus TaxID=76066 RepID=A0AAV7BXX6_ENGPU|nr:hypothetical protein GDO81_010198 [Engystomops pustulosus]